MYKSILKRGKDEFETKKSVFIGYSAPVQTEGEALEFISEIKAMNKDATHNCSAYIIGENMLIQRYNDDGEPSGTAGVPILEVLKKENLTNVAVVVTRYFGGTLLGAGGLIRAYTKGSKIAIDAGMIIEMKEYVKILLKYDYTFHGKILNFIENRGLNILNTIYTDKVELELLVPCEVSDFIKKELINITSADIDIVVSKEILMPEREGELIID